MFSDGDRVLCTFFGILLIIAHFQFVSVYSFITFVSHCPDRKSLRISLPCQYDSDCLAVENAICERSNSSCFCKSHYVLYKNRTHVKCLRVARALGDLCEENMQCQVKFGAEAECRLNNCQCSPGSRFIGDRCYETVGLGEYCKTWRNCYVEGSESACQNGRCVCHYLFHPSLDGMRCVKTIALRENCTSTEECAVKNSKCIGECRCDINHVISSNNSMCLKTANAIGDPCEEDLQCQDINFSRCHRGKCSCLRGYHRRSTTCHLDIGLNKPCEHHAQCVTLTNMDSDKFSPTNVDCIDGICSCSLGHTLTSRGLDCIGYAENGASSWSLSPIITLIITAFIIIK
ncbi:prion-like-(Q/N-rich) domain-bearing protein 25 isoform X1 [Leptopilina boulardi]|uniref:prion-like-(Q/N-rich) domain-bearing protein 25 isoform X1 n=1 Tax=Leptopilina boulardi TaxID=63433 RepID=UPI0021F5E11B|nr:prion-like-(Q/N-rich) domain-bearing protein 25 isoform X1 [Leptopilina boulardi]